MPTNTQKKTGKPFDRVVAIDLGNGMVNIRSLDLRTGKPYLATFPSAWAYKKDVGTSMNNKEVDVDTFILSGVEYVWGDGIAELDNIQPTYGHENRYKSESYKIMAEIAMAKVAYDLEIQPTENIYLVTGVTSKESYTSREEEIRQAFIGENKGFHEVTVNDQKQIFKIVHVEVMSQALSAVIARYLDEDGYEGDPEYQTMKVGVIDIGAGTIDLDIVNHLRRQKGYDSVPKGFRDIYDNIRTVIKQNFPSHNVSDYKLQTVLSDKSYKPSMRMEAVDFTKEVDNGVSELVVAIQTAIMSNWKDQTDMDEVLLIGATAKEFEEKLSTVVTGLTIPDNFATINVEGYFRWGMFKIAA